MSTLSRPSNGAAISQSGASYFEPRAYYQNNAYYAKYGCLYNLPAAMDISGEFSYTNPHRGICPEGWHIPTKEEWNQLEATISVGMSSSNTGAGKLAGGCDWYVVDYSSGSEPGNYTYPDRNNTGFSALPAGFWNNGHSQIEQYAHFWTTSIFSTSFRTANACGQALSYSYSSISQQPADDTCYGFSVRCVRN